MFSFIQNISRLYAFILVLLSIIVTFASISVVSMVQSYNYFNLIQNTLVKQRQYSQDIIKSLYEAKYEADPRRKNRFIISIKEELKNLKKQNSYFQILQNSKQSEKIDFIFGDDAIYELLHSALAKDLNRHQSLFISQIDHLLNDFNQLELNSIEHTSIEDITIFLNRLEKMGLQNFTLHKNLLLICVILFIFLIIIEAVIIYRPFSQRLKEKIEALTKEQELIAATTKRIKTKEERINLALQGADIGIFDWHVEEDKIYLSISACQLFNIPIPEDEEDAVISMAGLKDFIASSDKKVFEKALNNHLSNNKILNIDVRLKSRNDYKSDKTIWLNISGQAKWDHLGRAKRLAGILSNITAEKENEDLKKIFMSGVEKSRIAMAIIDVSKFSREFIYASPGLFDLLEFNKEQILKSNMYMLNGPDTKMEHIDRVEAILDSGKKGEIEITHYRSDGSPFLDKVSFIPIFNESHNTPIAYVSFHENISDKTTHNERDISRQRKEAIGELVNTITPEMISILSELQENSASEDLEKINRMMALQTSIAGFFDNKAAQNKQIAISNAIDKVVEDNKSIFQDAKISFKNDINDPQALAFVNDIELRQIIFNLTSNAVHSYMAPPKTVDISLYSKAVSFVDAEKIGLPKQSQEYAILEITDKGCGIPADIKTQIFDPLYSGWQNISTTGLGLTVAQAILKSWGGGIGIESIEGKGTSVKCYIPIFKSQEDMDFMEMADLLDELNSGGPQPY